MTTLVLNDRVKLMRPILERLFDVPPPKPDGLRLTLVAINGTEAEVRLDITDKDGVTIAEFIHVQLYEGNSVLLAEFYKSVRFTISP